MKHAILAVYFGSRDTRSMDLLEQALSNAFPSHQIHRAFLCSRFPGAPSVEQALAQLQAYDSIFIQPMLVSRGPTYEKLLALTGNHPVGVPLLDDPNSCAEALRRWLPAPLLLMGHGASGVDFSRWLAALPDDIRFATAEGTPSLTDILPQLAERSLHLAPFLLTAGTHGTRDLTQWKETLEAAGCTVTIHPEPLAHCPQIRDLFIRHIALQMQQDPPTKRRKDAVPCTRD